MPFNGNGSTGAALEALRRGYTAVPIRDGAKSPFGMRWQHTRWTDPEQVTASFNGWAKEGASGIGLLLGEPSSGLIDVDLDHATALRLREHFLPPSAMMTGHAGRPRSHHWYRVITEDPNSLPSTRVYKLPPKEGKRQGATIVELRSTGAQTVIPPTIHPSNEPYRWEGEPWGGDDGPEIVQGRMLEVQVALLAMGAVLLDGWPDSGLGARHEAYLALAGGLLRFGNGVHPFWERNLPVVIRAMADVTHDSDGPSARVNETMETTLRRLREDDGKAIGFPKLAEIIGTDHAEQVRRLAKEVTKLGWRPTEQERASLSSPVADFEAAPLVSTLPPEERNPLNERINSWDELDLGPYLAGEVVMPEPSILKREDGKGLMYPGRVNSLYGKSESAKSWCALYAAVQEMHRGGRVLYIDLEDGPEGTVERLKLLGAGADDLEKLFVYVLPDGPLAAMQRGRFGSTIDKTGEANQQAWDALIERFDPTLIIADGMTVLYGLHGHDTNEAAATEVISGWLKKMCRGGATVIVIDHTGKGDGAGASPIGAHHKVAMVQGTALRVDPINRPMPGALGTVRLIVFKDRPGAVRRISSKDKEQVAGIVTLDSTKQGITNMFIEAPQDGEIVIGGSEAMEKKLNQLAASQELLDAMLAMFDPDDPNHRVTSKEVSMAYGEKDLEIIRLGWKALEDQHKVTRYGTGKGTKFGLYKPVSG
jgi:hypothetical protein